MSSGAHFQIRAQSQSWAHMDPGAMFPCPQLSSASQGGQLPRPESVSATPPPPGGGPAQLLSTAWLLSTQAPQEE